MRKIEWTSNLFLVLAVSVMPIAATAQEDVLVPGSPTEFRVEPFKTDVNAQFDVLFELANDEKDGEAPANEYWLGLQVATLPEITKRQLVINHGLAVEDVSPDSPAAKAEIRRYDILLQAGDTTLKSVADLIKAVEAAQGKEIII